MSEIRSRLCFNLLCSSKIFLTLFLIMLIAVFFHSSFVKKVLSISLLDNLGLGYVIFSIATPKSTIKSVLSNRMKLLDFGIVNVLNPELGFDTIDRTGLRCA